MWGIFMTRFTKQGKLAWDRNPINTPMGMESSAVDLLTRKLKNTDTAKSYP